MWRIRDKENVMQQGDGELAWSILLHTRYMNLINITHYWRRFIFVLGNNICKIGPMLQFLGSVSVPIEHSEQFYRLYNETAFPQSSSLHPSTSFRDFTNIHREGSQTCSVIPTSSTTLYSPSLSWALLFRVQVSQYPYSCYCVTCC